MPKLYFKYLEQIPEFIKNSTPPSLNNIIETILNLIEEEIIASECRIIKEIQSQLGEKNQ